MPVKPVSLTLVRSKKEGPVVILGAQRGYLDEGGLVWEAEHARVWVPDECEPTQWDREVVRQYLDCALGWAGSLGDPHLVRRIRKALKQCNSAEGRKSSRRKG